MKARSVAPVVAFVVIAFFAGCAAPPPSEGEAFLFPKLKYVAEPEFAFTSQERPQALRVARRHGAKVVCELIVDREGRVVRIRLVRGLEGPEGQGFYSMGIMQKVKERRFEPSVLSAPYRMFFFPVKVEEKTILLE